MRRIYPKLRLHAMVGGAHGLSIATAIRVADEHIATHAEGALSEIDERIATLRGMCGPGHTPAARAILDVAATIVDLAGLFSPPLCRAAQSLCTLAEKGMAGCEMDRAAVLVHLEALHLLRVMGGTEGAQSDAIVDGLKAVVARAR